MYKRQFSCGQCFSTYLCSTNTAKAAPVDDECTPGWHSVKCLDDGTVMRGEGCTSCGDCAMYDYTAATGGRATCELHGPDGSYSYSYSHSYSYSYAQGVTATYYFDGAEFPVPGECWYDDCDDDSDECAVHGLGPEYAKARPDGTPCDPGASAAAPTAGAASAPATTSVNSPATTAIARPANLSSLATTA